MHLITGDFETYYSRTFSLSKITTEEYVRSDEYETIGISVKLDDAPAEWFTGTHEEIKNWLQQFPWDDAMFVAHNAMFDATILSWRFDIHPKAIADTLSMARALLSNKTGHSLAALVKYYGIGEKGNEVVNALGKHRLDFAPHELAAYAAYCINDTELTYKLFSILADGYPRDEMKLIDLTIKMFTEPVLELNDYLLENHLLDVRDRKDALLAKVAGGDPEEAKKNIMSNNKFAELLRSYGVWPPTKVSPTTGKQTFAFAKTDEGMLALQEHESVEVQTLVAARLGVKSTLEETRTERFINIARRGTLPIPLKYYAAHTSRWGGSEKLNLQNLPSRGVNANTLKKAILAPKGYVIIDADSAQIEARVLAWMAGQDDLVEGFAQKKDVYKMMASAIYNKPVEEIDAGQRFVGKTTILGCFGADTQVLTNNGWKRIVDVQVTDTVWDGNSWVKHQGVVARGEKETIRAWGVNATPDHEILTEHGWREWYEVVTNPSLSQSAFAKARSPSSIGNDILQPLVGPQGGTQSSGAIVGGRGVLIATTSKLTALLGAIRALKARLTPPAKSTGGMRQSSLIWSIANDYLTASQAFLLGATQKQARCTPATVGAALQYTSLGEQTVPTSCGTSLAYPVGTTPHEKLTGWITGKDTNPETCGSQREARTCVTGDQLTPCKQKLQTYDIAYAGPNNRYTIATNAGPLIAHNCGYGLGAKKFQTYLKQANVSVEYDEAKHIIDTYRYTYPAIPALWAQGDRALGALIDGRTTSYGKEGVVNINGFLKAVVTPNRIPLEYKELRRSSFNGNEGIVYTSRTGITGIWGGKFTENIIQHLARVIIGTQMLRIAKRYRVVLTVHDAVAIIARKEEAKEAQAYVETCMRWVPPWAEGLPLNCESGMGDSYGDC